MAPHPTRILVVDDNEDAAIMACMLLDVLDYSAKYAFDASEALELAADFQPHVIFLDLSMPIMSGPAAAPLLRARCEHPVHIVALSALNLDLVREQTLRGCFNGHLVKPAPLEELVAAIEGWRATNQVHYMLQAV